MKMNMINKWLLTCCIFSFVSNIYSQYQKAPEVWSEPKKILGLRLGTSENMPSITPDGKKIYFVTALPDSSSNIYYSEKTNLIWNRPIVLNSKINKDLEISPSISPDGKKLYFIRYGNGYGNWDIWVSEWSDSLKDWGESKNLGSNINTEAIEWVCTTPDDKNLYFVRSQGFANEDIMISEWDDSLNQWGPSRSFDNHQLNKGQWVSCK